MSIRGIFPAFMKQLQRQWTVELPSLSGIPGALGSMPKASTFYAGKEPAAGRHVFVWIQASVKRPGEFTVNIVLSDAPDAPAPWRPLDRGAFTSRAVGLYRLGDLVRGSDKWWCLAQGPASHGLRWRASSYHDQAAVFEEAIADVTVDVRAVLAELGLRNDGMQQASHG